MYIIFLYIHTPSRATKDEESGNSNAGDRAGIVVSCYIFCCPGYNMYNQHKKEATMAVSVTCNNVFATSREIVQFCMVVTNLSDLVSECCSYLSSCLLTLCYYHIYCVLMEKHCHTLIVGISQLVTN